MTDRNGDGKLDFRYEGGSLGLITVLMVLIVQGFNIIVITHKKFDIKIYENIISTKLCETI